MRTSLLTTVTSAANRFIGLFKSKPSDLADKYYADLTKGFDESTKASPNLKLDEATTSYLDGLKNAAKDALTAFEQDNNRPQLLQSLTGIKTQALKDLPKLAEERLDKADEKDELKRILILNQQKKEEALKKYFADIDAYLASLQNLGTKSDYGYKPAHENKNAESKEKVAIINGDKTADPRKKDPGVDLSGYSVPVHFDKKNGQFTFYNVEETKLEDAIRAVNALADQGFTGIKITGEFKDNIKQEMWFQAQCREKPLKVEGYAPTEGDFKRRDEFRERNNLPSIQELNEQARAKAKETAKSSKKATREAQAPETNDRSLGR